MSGKRRFHFVKMQGAGNDYVYVDTLGTPTSVRLCGIDIPDLSRKISDRHFGVGGDGLIIISPSANADFRMRIFNSDGSEAQMCGNGTRCVAKYLYDRGFTDKQEIHLETKAGIKVLYLHIDKGEVSEVTVDMGFASLKRGEIPAAGSADETMTDEPVEAADKVFLVTGVGMGNPHGVIFTDSLTDSLVWRYGKILENADIWPERGNIEFVEVLSKDRVRMRVWERGSGETLACGTGACASVVAAFIKGLTGPDVTVDLPGGSLRIHYDIQSGHVFMSGGAEFVVEGDFFCN